MAGGELVQTLRRAGVGFERSGDGWTGRYRYRELLLLPYEEKGQRRWKVLELLAGHMGSRRRGTGRSMHFAVLAACEALDAEIDNAPPA